MNAAGSWSLRFTLATLLAWCCGTQVNAQDLSGTYRIQTVGSGALWHENGGFDKIVSTRYWANDDYTRFILEKQNDGSYRIKVKATNRYLHSDGEGDGLLSTREQPNDDNTRFLFEAAPEGGYRIKVKGGGKYLHENASDDKLVSVRYQPNDEFTRFVLATPDSTPEKVTPAKTQDLSGTYRIQTVGSGSLWHENGGFDKIVSTRYWADDDYTRFILEKQNDGSYRIKVKATNRYLHSDGEGDGLLSTREQPNDDNTRFLFEAAPEGGYRIKVKGGGKYLHENASDDKLVSVRYQPNNEFTRFVLATPDSTPQKVTAAVTPSKVPPVVDESGSGGKRVFFIMGHHANTVEKLNEYVANGANFIEHDIHMYTKPLTFSGSDEVYIIHFMKDEIIRQYTNSDGIDAYYQTVKQKMDSGQILGLLCDIKGTLVSDGPIHYSLNYPDPRKYGRTMANILKRHRIPADRVIMGVDATLNKDPKWAQKFMAGVRADAKYDCLLNLYVFPGNSSSSQEEVNQWADSINASSDIAELGIDSKVRMFTADWDRWTKALIDRRDAKKGDIRFVYRWTLNPTNFLGQDTTDDIHLALARNVDGILTDDPAGLKAILNQSQYQAKYRIASRGDYPIPPANRVKRSLENPFVYITFRNNAAFDAWFTVKWYNKHGLAQSWDSGKCMIGQGAECAILKTELGSFPIPADSPDELKNTFKKMFGDGPMYSVKGARIDGDYPAEIVKGANDSNFEMKGTLLKGWFEKK